MEITFDLEKCVKCGLCVRVCTMGFLRMTEGAPALSGRSKCIGCLQCAAVCPTQAVLADRKQAVVNMPEDPTERLIMSRRSIRTFKKELPSRELLEWAIQRAGYAPSGKNRRDNRWTVVYGRERVEKASEIALAHCLETGEAPELMRFAEKGMDILTGGAPVLLLAWSPDECLNPTVDPIIALTTAELLLTSRGVGTCWGGYIRQITGHCPALKEYFGIPEGCSLRGCLMLGLPGGAPFKNLPARPEATIHWV